MGYSISVPSSYSYRGHNTCFFIIQQVDDDNDLFTVSNEYGEVMVDTVHFKEVIHFYNDLVSGKFAWSHPGHPN